jgi:hypothetical protein
MNARTDHAADLASVLARMLGAAEVDCMDDKSNEWRSHMIDARDALAAYDAATEPTPPRIVVVIGEMGDVDVYADRDISARVVARCCDPFAFDGARVIPYDVIDEEEQAARPADAPPHYVEADAANDGVCAPFGYVHGHDVGHDPEFVARVFALVDSDEGPANG